MDTRTGLQRVTERERAAADNLIRSAAGLGYVLEDQRAIEIAREVIEEEDEDVPTSGAAWVEERGDTVWLFSGAPGFAIFRYDAPATHFYLLPAEWPSGSDWSEWRIGEGCVP